MPTNNFKLFDQNKANLLSDTEYLNATQRLNGVQTGVASSQLQNKFAYQVSLVAYAIAQIMNQNGLDASDTLAVSAFVGNLGGSLLQKVADKASTAEAAAGVLTNKYISPATMKAAALLLSGGVMSGTLDMNNNKITNLPTPTSSSEPATKGYVDGNRSEIFAEETINANVEKDHKPLFQSKTIAQIFAPLIENLDKYGQIFFKIKSNNVTMSRTSDFENHFRASIQPFETSYVYDFVSAAIDYIDKGTTVYNVTFDYKNFFNWNYIDFKQGAFIFYFGDINSDSTINRVLTNEKFYVTTSMTLPNKLTGSFTYQVGATLI